MFGAICVDADFLRDLDYMEITIDTSAVKYFIGILEQVTSQEFKQFLLGISDKVCIDLMCIIPNVYYHI